MDNKTKFPTSSVTGFKSPIIGGSKFPVIFKYKYLIIVAVSVILALAGIWYWRSKTSTPSKVEPGLGSQLFEKTQSPVKNVPETNPFGKLQINPFKSIYTNPFK